MGLAILCTKTLQECLRLGVRWWSSGVFNTIGTEGRGFEPRPGLAVPQKLLLEYGQFQYNVSGATHYGR